VAFTIDHHICLRPGFGDSEGQDYTRVLAHEIAHAVQKRLGGQKPQGSAAPGWLLEWEADRAARQVLRGEPVSQLTADKWTGPRCWDIEGHYYTILWISLAAGLPLADARRNAFYAQLPDQVVELDAVPSGFSWFEEFAWASYSDLNASGLKLLQYEPHVGIPLRAYLKANPWVLEYWTKQSDPSIDKMVNDWIIQAGMHALTGRIAEDETTIRLQRLEALTPRSFEFALALHPFGDSFAHRIATAPSTMMYPPPLGHGCKGHGADMLQIRSQLYVKYGLALYRLLEKKWETEGTPHWDAKTVARNLEVVSSVRRDLQVEMLLSAAQSALAHATGKDLEECQELLSTIYRPENESDSIPWTQFFIKYRKGTALGDQELGAEIPLEEHHFTEAKDHWAPLWAVGAETFGFPPFMELFSNHSVITGKWNEWRGQQEF